MNLKCFLKKTISTAILVLFYLTTIGQTQVQGTVYDRSVRHGLQGVSVMGSFGQGTVTDSLGRYRITLTSRDSIQFSYLGKSTQKFPVKNLEANQAFDISLQVDVDLLPTVVVQQRNYKEDSLENRNYYRKVFDYSPDYLSNRSEGLGVGVSLDMLFSGKKIRQMETLRRRLEQEERDKYVDYRFNKALVRRITGLQSPALDSFMIQYRPSYEMIQRFETDYEYYKFIKDWAANFSEIWRTKPPIGPF